MDPYMGGVRWGGDDWACLQPCAMEGARVCMHVSGVARWGGCSRTHSVLNVPRYIHEPREGTANSAIPWLC